MSKRNGKAKARRELKEEYLPSGYKKSLRIEDLDLDDAVKRASDYEDTVLQPVEEAKVTEAIDDFDEVIETQEQLLELFKPERLTFSVVFPLRQRELINGEVITLTKNKVLKFKLKSVEATDDLKSLQMDFSIYTDLSELEKTIMQKGAQEGQDKLTSSEKKLYAKTEKKLENKIAGNLLVQVHNVLATYVNPIKGPEFASYEQAHEFWSTRVPFDLKTFIASQAMERLGLTPDSDIKLFQVG